MAAEYNGARPGGGPGPGPGSAPEPRPGSEGLLARLRAGPPIVLDGATGTELERMGHFSGLPLWSTHALLEAPEAVAEVHRRYREAGAEVVTANTFRTQRRSLARAGLGRRDRELTARAVELARAAGAAWVAGSAPPLEDCFQPDLVPDEPDLADEHLRHAHNLAEAGVDLVLCETLNTIREARAACRAARATGLPFWASFVSWQPGRLLSGEDLAAALRTAVDQGASAVLVNCLPPSALAACWPALVAADAPFGVYPNMGEPVDATGDARREDCTPGEFAALARGWLEAGASIVGGCCGTTPDHIRALARQIG
ncbi:MAG: homocysteine S-methyltransferase family protein [Myxococcota bacterium]